MKKILLSILTVGVVGAVAYLGYTGAFFSDTEKSEGNTLVAGAIDLKVDNTCYYNGRLCTEQGVFEGTDERCTCTWLSEDLTDEHQFFDLSDIKPGDWEEDTISLTVENNEAWLCADVKLVSDTDETCTEPESEATNPDLSDADLECNAVPGTPAAGELASRINFLWWADDGDNVLENCIDAAGGNIPNCVPETALPAGPLGVLGVGNTAHVTLADSSTNIWTRKANDPIPQGGAVWYIGKGWCFGEITEAPVPQDGLSATGNNGPNSSRGGGFKCDGSDEGNETQTDKMTADISFRAVQARNNSPFSCQPQTP